TPLGAVGGGGVLAGQLLPQHVKVGRCRLGLLARRRQVPEQRDRSGVPRSETLAVRTKGERAHDAVVSLELMHLPTRRRLEQDDAVVLAGKGDQATVGRKGARPLLCPVTTGLLVSLELVRFQTVPGVPQLRRLVPGVRAQDPFAVRGKGQEG